MTVHVSEIVAGCWRLDRWGWDVPARVRWIEAALDLGLTSFDHADCYGGYTTEALFGEALAATPGLRERLQIVTKCGIRIPCAARSTWRVKAYDSSREHILASVDASLAALRTDRIDLLLVHRPDALAEPDEIADAFRTLKFAGKVRAFGVSNHSAQQFAMLHRRFPLVTNQLECSPLQMRALADGTLDQATDLGLRPMIWSPLGGGRLFTGDDEQSLRVREVLADLAHECGVSPATIAYAWIRRHPSRPIPITGSGRVEALREAVASLSLRLDREQWTRVWQASMGHPVP